ncbi:MAG: hypothetical protein GX847_04640 [Clostridiales bacterium]|nr:hypothetical protein [Clostridiales bacterium]
MKCENCGKEEVNFRFTSNVNGNITEKQLCAGCAVKLGFAGRPMPRMGMSFEEIFRDLLGSWPSRRMFSGYGLMLPTFVIPAMNIAVPDAVREVNGKRPENQVEIKPEIDAHMQKRREINVLREQMHQAAIAEDYEKAAAIRDSIKELENGENS